MWYLYQDTIREVKKQVIDQEEVQTKHTTEKGLISVM